MARADVKLACPLELEFHDGSSTFTQSVGQSPIQRVADPDVVIPVSSVESALISIES